ncbi:hypothetical protein ABW20_dc0105780 [Dactylellina cionopaga]|nr:hypothetical protein ABW20_dc0105780 [Dactylellina cionopaga]
MSSTPVIDLTCSPPRKRQRVVIDLTGNSDNVGGGSYSNSYDGNDESPPPVDRDGLPTPFPTPPTFISPPLSPSDPLNDYIPPVKQDLSDPHENLEVNWIFYVKSVADERQKPASNHTGNINCSDVSTKFFVHEGMAPADLAGLQGDMGLARKIGFLPFISTEKSKNAIVEFARQEYIKKHPGEELGGKGGGEDGGNWAAKVLPPLMDADWYPGFFYYLKLKGEWFARFPRVRELAGDPGFLVENWEGELESRASRMNMRSFDWTAWETRRNR